MCATHLSPNAFTSPSLFCSYVDDGLQETFPFGSVLRVAVCLFPAFSGLLQSPFTSSFRSCYWSTPLPCSLRVPVQCVSIAPCCLRGVRPIQCHFLFLICFYIGVCVLFYTASFEILSSHLMFKVCRRHRLQTLRVNYSWFQTSVLFWTLYCFVWAILLHLNFTSAHKIQKLGNHPQKRIQHFEWTYFPRFHDFITLMLFWRTAHIMKLLYMQFLQFPVISSLLVPNVLHRTMFFS
jgi:hypothetical protein